MNSTAPAPAGEITVFQAPDGAVRVQVRLERDTVWLTQAQMAELFGRERSVVTKHVRNVFREGELDEKSNVQNLHIPGSDKPTGFYSLDVIISVGPANTAATTEESSMVRAGGPRFVDAGTHCELQHPHPSGVA